jgi:hypothetical protein
MITLQRIFPPSCGEGGQRRGGALAMGISLPYGGERGASGDPARSNLDRAGKTPPPSAEGGWGTPGGKPPGGDALKSP